jgi:hypothetical protein
MECRVTNLARHLVIHISIREESSTTKFVDGQTA